VILAETPVFPVRFETYHFPEAVMKRIALALASLLCIAADERPFGAIETRPLWERPSGDLTLQRRTEDALDRGTGRIEDEPSYQVGQIERDQRLDLDRRTPSEVYRDEHDRQERLDRGQSEAQRDQSRAQRLQRNEEALEAARRRWMNVVARENAAGGAVVDRQALDRVEQEYSGALRTAAQQRDAEFAAIDADKSLTAEQLRTRRDAAIQRYEQARAAAVQQREQRRASILGYPKE
jgi:hypothetical protein